VTRTRVTLAAGLALVAIAVGVTLSGSPVVVVHANSAVAAEIFAETRDSAAVCQSGETLAGSISAIRVTLVSVSGPRVSVTARSGTHLLTSGVVAGGWTGGSVTIPVRPVARATSHVRICFTLGSNTETVAIIGEPTTAATAARSPGGQLLPGRITIEYLRASHSSWWSVAPRVASRIGFNSALGDTWIVLPLIVLMAAVVAGASWLTLRELR
jgi:hypothetical protein